MTGIRDRRKELCMFIIYLDLSILGAVRAA